MSRKHTRENAYKLIFSYVFGKESNDYAYEEMILSDEMDDDDKAYLSEIFHNIPLRYEELIADITPFLRNYTIDRRAIADLSALILSAYEMKYMPAVPAKVSINEAVNLAKKYSTENSGGFVNGVLGNLYKFYRGE